MQIVVDKESGDRAGWRKLKPKKPARPTNAEKCKAYRARKKAAGLCFSCGKNPFTLKSGLCDPCRTKYNERTKSWHKRTHMNALPVGRVPVAVKAFCKQHPEVPKEVLRCTTCRHWYSEIDALAPAHWENSRCKRCDKANDKLRD